MVPRRQLPRVTEGYEPAEVPCYEDQATRDAEYERACELVKEITGRDTVYAREWFGESLSRRNPYVDPLHFLQVDLLDRTHRTPAEERTLRLTVKGIAAGMKNTG